MTRSTRADIRVGCKLWMERGGEPAFGQGRVCILQAVADTGSLSQAARELGMSYRDLWGRVRAMERRLGVKLVVATAGGRGGGGSTLTPAAEGLIAAWASFRQRARQALSPAEGELADTVNRILQRGPEPASGQVAPRALCFGEHKE